VPWFLDRLNISGLGPGLIGVKEYCLRDGSLRVMKENHQRYC